MFVCLFVCFNTMRKKNCLIIYNKTSGGFVMQRTVFKKSVWWDAGCTKCCLNFRLSKEKNSYMLILERWAFFNRVIKIDRDVDLADFNYDFNSERIVALSWEIKFWKKHFFNLVKSYILCK